MATVMEANRWTVVDHIFNFLYQLADNDTLIIIFVFILAFISPDHRELIAGGLIGYLGGKVKSEQNP